MKVTPERISKAINISVGKFDPARRARGRFMAQYVGRFYGGKSYGRAGSEDRKASPLNLIHSAVTTLVPNLVYNDPKVKLSTHLLPYRQYSDLLELATNHVVEKINLRLTLRKVIVDAIFMAGFVKTGIASDDQYVISEGHDIDLGMPFAERVDPDDMILDPMARDWDEQSFIGNRYRADLDSLLESGLYDQEQIEKLSSKYDSSDGAGQAEKLGGSSHHSRYGEVTRYVDLCDVYLPREGVVVTLPYSKDQVQPAFLRVAGYSGPEKGPYHMLGFAYVPDNLLPIAPASIWYDLHIMGNRIARKLARQAERLKRVLGYQGAAQDDVNAIAEADDGETVRVDDVNAMKELTFGGAAPESYEWMGWVKQHFSEQAGNLEMLSGSGTGGTPTATQAEMLQANTSVRLGDMQGLVYQFTQEVIEDLVCHIHTDPLIELPLARRVTTIDPMTGMPTQGDVQESYSPDSRKGDWLDYNVKVKPYSMARPDPNMSVRRKLEFATNVIPAAAQAAMTLGPGFMVGPFLKRIANEVGIDDADEFLNDPAIQGWTQQQMMMNTGNPGKAATGGQPAPAMPGQVGQPNPGAYGPSGGISPGTEQAMAQQETAGELQAGMEPSTKAMALAR